MIRALPQSDSIENTDYQLLLSGLAEQISDLKTAQSTRLTDMIDYYTVWVHQIKTPISSMRLTLQNEDSLLARKLSCDLSHIEQYVEMVLAFLRLDSDSSDYVLRCTSLIHCFVNQFDAFHLNLLTESLAFRTHLQVMKTEHYK